ncbi:MAG: hypothetical protein ACK4SU_02150 [Dictyoglomus sp.]
MTLEAAILKTPAFVFYKISPLTYYIAKRLVHYQYIALPNILLNKMIFPEYVQKIDVDEITNNMKTFFKDETYREKIYVELEQVKEKLGKPGVLEKIANFILNI